VLRLFIEIEDIEVYLYIVVERECVCIFCSNEVECREYVFRKMYVHSSLYITPCVVVFLSFFFFLGFFGVEKKLEQEKGGYIRGSRYSCKLYPMVTLFIQTTSESPCLAKSDNSYNKPTKQQIK
jgi:hypothetical protein